MFSRSKNNLFSGPSTFNLTQNIGSAQAIDEGLKILYDRAAPGALHDSGERFDPPNCHPNTRVAVLNEIMTWLDDLDTNFSAMWMNGPMGAGKSAIAQAIAQICYERKQLSSSFFFARSSALRNDEKKLVATLSYQMSKLIPDTRSAISGAILHDPLIFESSLASQIDALILGPLQSHSLDANASPDKPRLIIIDGLDECVNTPAQEHIIKAFISSISKMRHELPISHKVLIVSRSETNIKVAFHDPVIYPSVKQLSLNELWQPDHDIKTFLDDSFAKIKHAHILGPRLPREWPSADDIEKLVQKSSGQFIYAAVVIRFLQSPRNHPIQSLKIILDLVKGAKSQPYAELDALYVHIFSKVEDLDLVLRIFCLCFLEEDDTFVHEIFEDLLQLPDGMVNIALNDLVSVVQVNEDDTMTFHHASLQEFLEDKTRSGGLHVHSKDICLDLAGRCITSLTNAQQAGYMRQHPEYLNIIPNLADLLQKDVQISVYEGVSNMDIMSVLQGCTTADYDWDGIRFSGHLHFIQWIFETHIEHLASDKPHVISKAFRQIQEWILAQFKTFPFSGFDHDDGIDLWILATLCQKENHGYVDEDTPIQNLPSELSSSPEYIQVLLHNLPTNMLSNSDIFEEYSFTVNRYVQGAINLLQRLLSGNLNQPEDLETVSYFLGSLLKKTGPPKKELFSVLKQATVDNTTEFCYNSLEESFTEDERKAYQYLSYKYPCKTEHICDSCNSIACDLATYIESARIEMPDIDSILEEIEMSEEHSSGIFHNEPRKRKISQVEGRIAEQSRERPAYEFQE